MCGLLTERDFLKLPLEKGIVRRTLTEELMTAAPAVRSVQASDSVLDVVSTMRHAGPHVYLPVLDGSDLRAVISMQDISLHMSAMSIRSGAPT